MSKTIAELTDGYRGDIIVLLLQVNKGVTAKGAPYLSFQLQDKTGNMDAKYWNVSEELLYAYKPGMLVKINGDVLNHQKHLQYRVNHIDILNAEEYDIEDFVKSGPIAKNDLKKEIQAYVDSMRNETIKTITQAFLDEYDKDFYMYPAAMKNHHDFVSGLATHVLGMLHIGEACCKQYPLLHRDLLLAGIILHDLGKLIELSGAVVTDYTKEGKLLGHISIMQGMIDEKAKALSLDGEEILLLRHMILSHHGKYDFGSPVLPMIPEAEVLFLIDNIDARMQTMDKTLKAVEPGDFSGRVFALENRFLYRSTLEDK